MQGVEVHLLVPKLAGSEQERPLAGTAATVHQVFAGPMAGLGAWLAAHHSRTADSVGDGTSELATSLNWKGRIAESVKRALGFLLYPDVRAEWNPWASRAMLRLANEINPDVVITSHEPASVLRLGLLAKRRGRTWIADLGDPVCAPYTPGRWKRRAWKLERRVCERANHIIVPQERAASLLRRRHGLSKTRCSVLPQGFDDRTEVVPLRGWRASNDAKCLELLYTGRLYDYRWPAGLFQAVRDVENVRLTLVLPDASANLDRLTDLAGDCIQILGPLPHKKVVAMQRSADVLVNLGYRGLPAQVPAKIYEYLGAERPILHVVLDSNDPGEEFLKPLRRGWICKDNADRLASLLNQLVSRYNAGDLEKGLRLSRARVDRFAYSRQGKCLAATLKRVCREAEQTPSKQNKDSSPRELA